MQPSSDSLHDACTADKLRNEKLRARFAALAAEVENFECDLKPLRSKESFLKGPSPRLSGGDVTRFLILIYYFDLILEIFFFFLLRCECKIGILEYVSTFPSFCFLNIHMTTFTEFMQYFMAQRTSVFYKYV